MVWSDKQVDYWRSVYEAYLADTHSIAINADIDQQRQIVQQEMLQLLHGFLHREVTLQDFNISFKNKANGTWNVFHVRGFSGGMFLDKLSKHILDKNHLIHLLHVTLRLPKDTKEGFLWMQAFMQFLENTIASQQIARMQLQSSRIPFFLSIWWHLQAVEQWPIPYQPVQRAIMREKEDLEDPIEKYFEFRTRFVSLANTLGLASWQLDYLLTWHEQQQIEPKRASFTLWEHEVPATMQRQVNESPARTTAMQEILDTVERKDIISPQEIRGSSCRSRILWLLAKLGHKVGCQVWIRAIDHRQVWQNEHLGALSLPSLPTLADPAFQQEIEQIDILWLLNNEIVAAYEIEQAHTHVSIGLLRLFDLGTFFLNGKMHLCMIIPQYRFEKVRSELLRPVFQEQNLRQHCVLISQELLLRHAEHILRWARNLFVIDDLVSLSTDGYDQELSPKWSPTDKASLKGGA